MLLILIGIALGLFAFRMKTSKSTLTLFILGAVFVIGGLIDLAPSAQSDLSSVASATSNESSSRSPSPPAPTTNRREVTYKLLTSCSSGADLTFFNENGDITQYAGQGSGWEYSFEPKRGDYISLLAQNMCSSGYVTVQILHRGDVFVENTSVGEYVIASVDRVW